MARLQAPIIRQPQTLGRTNPGAVARQAGAVAGIGQAQRRLMNTLAQTAEQFIERKEREETLNSQTTYQVGRDRVLLDEKSKEYYSPEELRGIVPESAVRLTQSVPDERGKQVEVERERIPAFEARPYLIKRKLEALAEAQAKNITNPIDRANFLRVAQEDISRQVLSAGLESAREQRQWSREQSLNRIDLKIESGDLKGLEWEVAHFDGTDAERDRLGREVRARWEWQQHTIAINEGNLPAMKNYLKQLKREDYGTGENEFLAESAAAGPEARFNRERAINRLEQEIKSLTAAESARYRYEFQQALTSAKNGKGTGFVTEEWVDSRDGWSEEEKRVAKLKLQTANEIGSIFERSKMTSGAEDAAAMRALEAAPGGQQEYARTGKIQALSAALSAKAKEIKQDRVAYVLRNDESVAAAYQRMQEARGTAEEDVRRDEYANALLGAQEYLGPAYLSRPYLLTNAETSFIKSQFDAIENAPAAADTAVNLLTSLERQWGRFWPQIHAQLVDQEIISPVQSVVASQPIENRALSIELLRASATDEETYKARIPDYQQVEQQLNEYAANALNELRGTLVNEKFAILGGEREYTKYHDAVVNVLKYRAARGAPVGSSEAEEIAKRFITDRYQFKDTYRIPVEYHREKVVASAAWFKSEEYLSKLDFTLPAVFLNEKDAKARMVSALERDGIWVTNQDETGLVLIWPESAGDLAGQPVIYEDDGELRMVAPTFEDMELEADARRDWRISIPRSRVEYRGRR